MTGQAEEVTRPRDVQVLVVDDEPDILFATARVLRKAGFPVLEASSGEECLRLVEEQRPDLVLLDVVLPDIGGYEVCSRIKSDERLAETFVILISGERISSDDKTDGLVIGSDGYIVRPVSNNELLAWVESMSRIIRAERERDRLIEELQAVVARLNTLEGILPICSRCKRIRGDDGGWTEVEPYVSDRSKATFSHSICPDCAAVLYPDVNLSGD